MPIYEYQCQSCGHHLDTLQKVSDPVLTDCPACGKSALQKLISAAGFQLKGTGWYVTDFRDNGKQKTKNKTEGDKETKPEKTKENKTETNTATKTGTKAKTDSE